jgi:hypothetical protein
MNHNRRSEQLQKELELIKKQLTDAPYALSVLLKTNTQQVSQRGDDLNVLVASPSIARSKYKSQSMFLKW